jgi:hypothetical protein
MDLNTLAITPIFISGVIVGMIFFQAGIIAPSLFKTISSTETGPFLRVIFPKLFLLVFTLAAVSALILLIGDGSMIAKTVSIITSIFMSICYLIIPATNAAKDAGNKNTFNRLHRVSVAFTVIVLLLNIIWVFLI